LKAVQRQLGHRSATLTLDTYGHLWPDELEALGQALERLKTATPADPVRTPEADGDVITLAVRPAETRWGKRGGANAVGQTRWGGQGSNLRPTDYESAALTD
jgi:hypothetical protein